MALNQDELNVIDSIEMSERVKKIREEFFSSKIHITAARSHLATLSWKETEGEHLYMRRGKLFAKICNEIPIAILGDELVIGSQTPFVRGAAPQIDYSSQPGIDISHGDLRTKGDLAIAEITAEDLKLITEDTQYWIGKSPEERIYQALGDSGSRLDEWRDAGLCRPLDRNFTVRTRLLDYDKVLQKGLRSIIGEIDRAIEAIDFTGERDAEKLYFLRSGKLCCEAMIGLAKRYAVLARESAQAESDPKRKAELQTLAEICEWVPENPARTFWEALQSVRFIHLGANLETAGKNHKLGRLDQYLYPFYKKDREEGRLTLEQAVELMGCFQMKIAQMEVIHGGLNRNTSQGHFGTKVVLGGVDREGNDATNELTYIILHVAGLVRTSEPAYYVRWHPESPKEYLLKGVWANVQVGGGNPAFHNDPHTIRMLHEHGASWEDARDYAIYGCSHPNPFGGTSWSLPTLNGVKVFELMMYEGFDTRTNKQLGIKTGDPRTFTSIDDWIEAFRKQWEYISSHVIKWGNQFRHMENEHFAIPFHDMLHPDCIEKGLTVERGGCRYPSTLGQAHYRVFADTADSLTAIKKFVYDEKKLTVDEIMEACAHNFEGEKYAHIQSMLKSAPKYGNDLDEPDEMYRRLTDVVTNYVRSQKNMYGFPLRSTWSGASLHIPFGKATGALPSGRKAYTPVADGSISPVAGVDRKGPTASLRSAGKSMDWTRTTDAILNQKMPKSLLRTKEHYEKFWTLTETYFKDFDGYQIQWNIEDAEVYKAAKANPEAYRDLIVRVGGYSAYFIEISPVLQDEIISRTEQYI